MRLACMQFHHCPLNQASSVMHIQDGTLSLLDLGAASISSTMTSHSGPVWGLAPLPDSSGFVSCSADHRWGLNPPFEKNQLIVLQHGGILLLRNGFTSLHTKR